ncbi:SIR2 family protein [Psychrobacter faecalis]|uniref:SIR2 family protein n=2 Tax=Psychrobacter faecalis TaxID=180588 RepID=UPI003FD449FD
MEIKGIEHKLAEILANSASAPFLFIGSGFSRRYIGLPDWIGLLREFSEKPFESYLGKTNGNTPKAALELAKDFHAEWWEKNESNIDIYGSKNWVYKEESPLKYEISEYLKTYSINDEVLNNPELIELQSSKVVIDGIITTNWDLLLENLFPTLKPYVGQSDILFNYPTSVGGIFKIHGCCSRFDSLILSSNDYEDFNGKNPYLASKLLAIFLEKPVIFLGYSMSDENIIDILEKIVRVLDTQDKVDKLSKNLIFVSRAHGKEDKISPVIINIKEKSLTVTSIQTDDFGKIYKALQHSKRKIPVEILRIFEEQIYEIVNSIDLPDSRLKVLDFKDLIKGDDIEFVAGIGVASNSEYGKKGLSGITVMDLVRDIIFDHLQFTNEEIAQEIPKLVRNTPTYLPIRKYINNVDFNLPNNDNKRFKKRKQSSSQSFVKKISNHKNILSVVKDIEKPEDIIVLYSKDTNKLIDALAVWLNHNKSSDNCKLLKVILQNNYDIWLSSANESYFKRLVCIIDEIENNDLV